MEKSKPISGHTIVRMKDASDIVGFSGKHIRHLEKVGKFPGRVQLGPRAVGFRLKDLEQWIDERRVQNIEKLRDRVGLNGGEG